MGGQSGFSQHRERGHTERRSWRRGVGWEGGDRGRWQHLGDMRSRTGTRAGGQLTGGSDFSRVRAGRRGRRAARSPAGLRGRWAARQTQLCCSWALGDRCLRQREDGVGPVPGAPARGCGGHCSGPQLLYNFTQPFPKGRAEAFELVCLDQCPDYISRFILMYV